jgi:hypothetical protein
MSRIFFLQNSQCNIFRTKLLLLARLHNLMLFSIQRATWWTHVVSTLATWTKFYCVQLMHASNGIREAITKAKKFGVSSTKARRDAAKPTAAS